MPAADLNKNRADDPLCCCEYVDQNGDRNHLLALCCDCELIDDTCERLITRRPIPGDTLSRVYSILQDRVRIPCIDGRGAMKIKLDVVLPIVLLPSMILTAAQGVVWSVVAFTGVPLLCVYLYVHCLRANPRSRFFVVWAIASLVFLEGVMEVEVLPFLDILPTENFVLKCFIAAMLFCVYLIRGDPGIVDATQQQLNVDGCDLEDIRRCSVCNLFQVGRAGHCRICNTCILRRDHHCVWIDTCVGIGNHRSFIMGLVFLILSILYGCHLTLTTICQPILVLDLFLFPQDCRGVYENIHLAVCFVSAIYALMIVVAAVIFLMYQLCLISSNATISERFRAKHKGQRLSSHSKGIIRNWINFWRGPR